MRYAKITDGSMDVIGYPGWLDSSGQPLTDDVYIRDHGIYPIVEDHYGDDGYVEKDQGEWYMEATRVVVTYYTVVDNPPTVELLDTVVGMLPQELWVYDITHSTVEVRYQVRERTDEEIEQILSDYPLSNNGMDSNIYEPKPVRQWGFKGAYVEKRHYTILEDPERLTHSTIFYDITPTDRESWVVNGDIIQESCTFTPKTDMIAMKSQLNGYVADYRWNVEVGGYMFEGNTIATDRDSQSKILTRYIMVKEGTITEDIYWKTENGFYPLAPAKFIEMAIAVESFITEVYNKEHLLYIDIQGSEHTTDTFERLYGIYNTVGDAFDVEGSVYKLNEGV